MDKLKATIVNNNKYILDYGVVISNSKNILYTIRCRFNRNTAKNKYFENFVFDKNDKLTSDNIMILNDIKCEIIIKETFSNIIENKSHKAMLLQAIITDKSGNQNKENFNNKEHNGSAFIELINLINNLK